MMYSLILRTWWARRALHVSIREAHQNVVTTDEDAKVRVETTDRPITVAERKRAQDSRKDVTLNREIMESVSRCVRRITTATKADSVAASRRMAADVTDSIVTEDADHRTAAEMTEETITDDKTSFIVGCDRFGCSLVRQNV